MRRLFWVVVWFSLVSLACSLSSSEEPPIIVSPPKETSTPQPPLGYATPLPGTVEGGVNSEQQQQQIDVQMFNLLNQVEADRLVMHVQSLVNVQTRHVNSSQTDMNQGIGAARSYISGQFEQIQSRSNGTFRTFEQPFNLTYNGVNTVQHNVVGYIQGTDTGAGVIIVGAHYDSRTYDLRDASAYAPGAVDNGSGVAAVIELARILSQNPLRASVMFVLFSAEEVGQSGQGGVGSQAFVNDYLLGNGMMPDQIIGMINLDTIGNWDGPNGEKNDADIRLFSSPPNDSPARQLARSINFIAYNYNLDLNVILQDQIDREGRFGDHNSFDNAGYAAVRLIEAVEDTSSREGDDIFEGLEPAYLENATRTVLGIIAALSSGPQPPQNIVLRDNGDGTSSLVWEPTFEADRYIVGLRRPNSMIFNQHFTVTDNFTAGWANTNWQQYEAVAIAAVDSRGYIGRFSVEYKIP